MEENKDATKGAGEKKHVCSVCAKPSDAVICHACEDKIRGETLEHTHDVNKAGRTDTGRR